MQFLGLGALGFGATSIASAAKLGGEDTASLDDSDPSLMGSDKTFAAGIGPFYDHSVNTTTELKDTPVPTASIEVVSPDGTETTVAVYRDGTDNHGYDASAHITIEQSRNGGQDFSAVSTITNNNIDGARTGNGLLALDDTTLYFFDSQVDYSTSSNELTAVHRLDWDDGNKMWTVTTNVNEYPDYRILPHYTENDLLNVGYVDFTASPQKVRFAEFDTASETLNTLGVINEEPIRPNEHVLQPRNDGTLVSIVRCEAPDVDTRAPVEQWCTSSNGGQTWTNHGYIEETLHPSADSYGATKGAEMIDTPNGERMVFLYRWIQHSSSGSQETVLGIVDPTSGVIERNIIINTVDSNEGANGSLQLVESNPQSWRFYVVHEQGYRGSNAAGSGVFFRDLTVNMLSSSDDFGGRYYLKNVYNDYVAEVEANSTANGAPLIQWSYHGGDNQLWELIQNNDRAEQSSANSRALPGDGTYRLENVNSGKVADVDGSSTSDGANIIQWPWKGTDNQKWDIIQNTDGTYRLENVNSGKVLDITGTSTTEGDQLIQAGWANEDWQKWTIHSI